MAEVCFYFQVHQPWRLRRYSVFETAPQYFDDEANAEIVRRVAEKCYLPATRILASQCRKLKGKCRLAFSITGVALEQLERYAPEAVAAFRDLVATGCVELLGETYHHSLSVLCSPTEFAEQVALHRQMVQRIFGQQPRIFRNTELIYSNRVAAAAAQLGFAGALTEGWEPILKKRRPGNVYRAAGSDLLLLLRNYGPSDDITFRFGRTDLPGWPLTPKKFAARVKAASGKDPLCNLFMDFETFGEHQWEATGILDFLAELPAALLAAGHRLVTPSEALERHAPAGTLDVPTEISWADAARDLSAWQGNAMQTQATIELYRLETAVKTRGDGAALADWRRLTTSDHVYYMSTKHFGDGAVHAYFNPYDSPYDAYINFMNVLDNLRGRVR